MIPDVFRDEDLQQALALLRIYPTNPEHIYYDEDHRMVACVLHVATHIIASVCLDADLDASQVLMAHSIEPP
jgi:hypothetical protein